MMEAVLLLRGEQVDLSDVRVVSERGTSSLVAGAAGDIRHPGMAASPIHGGDAKSALPAGMSPHAQVTPRRLGRTEFRNIELVDGDTVLRIG